MWKIEFSESRLGSIAHPEWELTHSWHLATVDAILYCSVELRRDYRPYARQSGQLVKGLNGYLRYMRV